MKTPICELCAKSGALCSGCEEKQKNGVITELDVTVSNLLYKLKDKYTLDSVQMVKALDLGRVILILTKSDVGVLIGKEGKVVSELSQTLGKKVRIAESTTDVKKAIYDILTPVKLLGVNTVYKNGETFYKVRILKSEIRHLPMDINTLEKALNSLMGSKVAIIFE
ncbi:MAG: KH domain-containing protein [Candidatus Micrarchaeota archaeon]